MNKEVYRMMLEEIMRVRVILEEEGERIERFLYEAIEILEMLEMPSIYSKELSNFDRVYSCCRENRDVLLKMIYRLEDEFKEIIHILP